MGMLFRKRKSSGPELAKILDSYQATTTPAGPTSAVATIRCWQCSKPNIYDARRTPPRRCSWCKSPLS
jgi:hypothetical protein